MTTPQERREMFLDADAQTEEWNRAQAAEYADARVDYYAEPRFSRSEIAEMNAEAERDR